MPAAAEKGVEVAAAAAAEGAAYRKLGNSALRDLSDTAMAAVGLLRARRECFASSPGGGAGLSCGSQGGRRA